MPVPRFKNASEEPVVPGVKQLLKWTVVDSVRGRRRRAPRTAPVPVVANDGRRLREQTALEAATWIGHATFLIQTAGLAILTDPIFSDRIATIRRNVPPGLRLEDLPPIDVVLVSHNHRDHLDLPTLRRLRTRLVLVPAGVGRTVRRAGLEHVVELEWWQSHDVGDVRFTFVPSHHWSGRSVADRNRSLWGGWGVLSTRHRLYFAGDTGYFAGFREIGERLGPLDTALLPVGSYDPRWFMRAQHMDPADAIRAFADLGAERMIAMHWGTFKLTDEPLDEPPRLLEDARRRAGIDPHRVLVPAIGQTIELKQRKGA